MVVVTVQADAAVTRSCIEEGEYGRYRLWGAIGEQRAPLLASRHPLAIHLPCVKIKMAWQPAPPPARWQNARWQKAGAGCKPLLPISLDTEAER